MPSSSFVYPPLNIAKSFGRFLFNLYSVPIKYYQYRAFCRKSRSGQLDPCFNTIISKCDLDDKLSSFARFYPSETFYSRLPCNSNNRFNNAAVIFNSSLSRKYGSAIDESDIVIRVNFMPTYGFEEYVGSKTTIRVLGRSWLFKEHDELLVRSYTSSQYIDDDLYNLSLSKCLRSHGVYASNDKLIQLIYYDCLRGLMTNGFRAVLLALELANNVTIYGGDPLNRHWWYPFYKRVFGFKPNHFPSAHHLPLIKDLQTLADVQVDYESYFQPFTDKSYRLHGTVAMEYAFYLNNPRITMK